MNVVSWCSRQIGRFLDWIFSWIVSKPSRVAQAEAQLIASLSDVYLEGKSVQYVQVSPAVGRILFPHGYLWTSPLGVHRIEEIDFHDPLDFILRDTYGMTVQRGTFAPELLGQSDAVKALG